MSIEVLNETDVDVDLTELADCARFVLAQLHVHPQAELAITVIDEAAMAELHKRWMDLPGPTDVMSFPMDELRPGSEHSPSEGVLGDIVLCPTVAAAQARTAGHTLHEELLLLTVHGILHLLGFDHAEEAERTEMFDLQRTLLLTYLASRGRQDASIDPPRGDETYLSEDPGSAAGESRTS